MHRFLWNVGGVVVQGSSHDDLIGEQWDLAFVSRSVPEGPAELDVRLERVESVPPPPSGLPELPGSTELISYHGGADLVVVHLPRFARLELDLATGRTEGVMTDEARARSGVFEDLVAVALAPHLRRRQRYFVHAFAAAHHGRAVLLVGAVGAGKTTTGLAAVLAGWQIVSNDSPLVGPGGRVFVYPGLVSAHLDTLDLLDLRAVLDAPARPGEKVSFSVAALGGDWADEAEVAAVCFPELGPGTRHSLDPLGPAEALLRLLPHSVEPWDPATTDGHLATLREVLDRAPAYRLGLAPDPTTVPELLLDAISS